MQSPATVHEDHSRDPRKADKNEFAGEVKRKARRLQADAPPDDLVQQLQDSVVESSARGMMAGGDEIS